MALKSEVLLRHPRKLGPQSSDLGRSKLSAITANGSGLPVVIITIKSNSYTQNNGT